MNQYLVGYYLYGNVRGTTLKTVVQADSKKEAHKKVAKDPNKTVRYVFFTAFGELEP